MTDWNYTRGRHAEGDSSGHDNERRGLYGIAEGGENYPETPGDRSFSSEHSKNFEDHHYSRGRNYGGYTFKNK
jgi:hypothetical protein